MNRGFLVSLEEINATTPRIGEAWAATTRSGLNLIISLNDFNEKSNSVRMYAIGNIRVHKYSINPRW
jgi:hypothetical protein